MQNQLIDLSLNSIHKKPQQSIRQRSPFANAEEAHLPPPPSQFKEKIQIGKKLVLIYYELW